MEVSKTQSHVYLDYVNQIIDEALADMEIERSRVDISWLSSYNKQLQRIALALEEARQHREIDEGIYTAKSTILDSLAEDINEEEHKLRKHHPNWDQMNTVQKEMAMAECFDRTRIVHYMSKLEELAFR